MITRQIYEKFPRQKLKKLSLLKNLTVYWKNSGPFVRKYFCHIMLLYDQTSLKKFLSILKWIDFVFCFLLLLEFLFKAWFPLKPLVLLKLLTFSNGLLFLPCMCILNATRKNNIYSLADEVQCHNKWKLMCVFLCLCVCVCVCVCNGNMLPIISMKPEGKLQVICQKVKSIWKIFAILR